VYKGPRCEDKFKLYVHQLYLRHSWLAGRGSVLSDDEVGELYSNYVAQSSVKRYLASGNCAGAHQMGRTTWFGTKSNRGVSFL